MDVCNFRIWCKEKGGDLVAGDPNVPVNPNEIKATLQNWGKGVGSPSMHDLPEESHGVTNFESAVSSQIANRESESDCASPIDDDGNDSVVDVSRNQQWVPTFSNIVEHAGRLATRAIHRNKSRQILGAIEKLYQALDGTDDQHPADLDKICEDMLHVFRPVQKSPKFIRRYTQEVHNGSTLSQLSQVALPNGESAPGNFVLGIALKAPPTVPQGNRGPRKRLMALPEALRQRKRSKSAPVCGFCGFQGHNKQSCQTMIGMGKQIVSEEEKVSVLANLKGLVFPVACENSEEHHIPAITLPKNMQSLVIHGSTKAPNGTLIVMAGVFQKGGTRHPMFPLEKEPHPIAEMAATAWISSTTKSRHTFVKHQAMLVSKS